MVNNGKLLVVAGGAKSNFEHESGVEVYDVGRDKWFQMPSLNEKKYSPTIVNVKDQMLYSFGGASKKQVFGKE